MSWFANIYEDAGERLACALGCIALGVGLEFAQRLTANVALFDKDVRRYGVDRGALTAEALSRVSGEFGTTRIEARRSPRLTLWPGSTRIDSMIPDT